jgi:IclR family KDG regulon transcriptional repressor
MTDVREGLSSVYNAMRILREFMNEGKEIGISELGTRLGLAKSTIFRMVKTMVIHQLVEKNKETDKYYLGVAAFELGFAVYHTNEIRSIGFPVLDKLMNLHKKVTRLGVYSQSGVIFLCNRVPEGVNSHYSKIGSSTPIYCTALGKVLLAYQTKEEIERVLKGSFKVYTMKTIVNKDVLYEQLMEIRQNGYGYSNEEFREGRSSVAVPVYDDDGQVIAAISLSDSNGICYTKNRQTYINELKQCSQLITHKLGMT